MDRVFSPWRSEHVSRVGSDDQYDSDTSIFSAIAESDRDEENLVLWRGTQCFVVMNLYPYTNGHLMVVPYRQVAHLEGLTAEELFETSVSIQYCISWLKEVFNPDGFNVGMNLGKAAGAGITTHLHAHVVPRWEGDTNFTTVLGDYRVIPESLQDTYTRLAAEAKRNPIVIPNVSQ